MFRKVLNYTVNLPVAVADSITRALIFDKI